MGRSLVSRAISRSLFMLVGSSAYLAHYGMRSVGGVRPYFRRPVTFLGRCQPSRTVDYRRCIHFVQGEIARHAITVCRLHGVARAAADARYLQYLRHMLTIVDTIECRFMFSGYIHLHQVDIRCARAFRHLSCLLRYLTRPSGRLALLDAKLSQCLAHRRHGLRHVRRRDRADATHAKYRLIGTVEIADQHTTSLQRIDEALQ